MSPLFCCPDFEPFKPKSASHERKFKAFMKWATFPKDVPPLPTDNGKNEDTADLNDLNPSYVLQFVRQISFAAVECKRYFMPDEFDDGEFVEVSEEQVIKAGFEKLKWYKNFVCETHKRWFELNLYRKDPVERDRVKVDTERKETARPAGEIDL